MLRATILLSLLSTMAWGQANLLSIDTLWLHMAQSEDEDISSSFPILKSPVKASIATNINTVLQMQALGYIINDKTRATLLNQSPEPTQRTNISFAFNRMTDRLISIDILVFQLNNAMSLNGWHKINRYYFDATNGHPVSMREVLFNGETILSQMSATGSGLRDNMLRVMKRYRSGFGLQDMLALDDECRCNCTMTIKNAYRENRVRFFYDESVKKFQFSMDDCDWMNPRQHDVYETYIRQDQTDPWLTPYGKYLVYGGTPVANGTYFKLWKGTIDDKIPVTFFLWINNVMVIEGQGWEIYDRHGVSIPLHVQVTPDDALEIHELEKDGKMLATITAKLENGKLVGKWVKADGSKTLPFVASPAK